MKRYRIALLRSLILILPVIVIAWLLGNRFFSSKGYDGTGDFLTSFYKEIRRGSQAHTEDVYLFIDDEGMAFLEERVAKTKTRGIHTNKGGDNYVEGSLLFKKDTLSVKIRIKGHMMDHFQGDKWSFRVKTKGDKKFRGMRSVTFQHPGTRGYVNEWVYHELARREGLIVLQYDFFRLHLNGKDLGIYALEEHFGVELAQSNQRPDGSFLRWNPNLYWEGRLDEKDKIDFTKHAYMDFSASYVDPYAEGEIKKDEKQYQNFLKAAAALEAFRRGKKSTSEVFDVEKLARLHAIIDLVGGHHSLDWSDVKYFYNALTDKIEPVAYESFSIRPTKVLAGQRSALQRNNKLFDFHDLLFNDMEFYAAYVIELEKMSAPDYLNGFFDSIQPELQEKRSILAQEFPYKRFETKPYFENQTRIKKLLATPMGFHAHLRKIKGKKVTIDVANMHEFPFEITEVVVNGKAFKVQEYVPFKIRNAPIQYKKLKFEFAEKLKDKGKKNEVTLKYRLPGSKQEREMEVSLIPAYTTAKKEIVDTDFWPAFLVKNDDNKTVIAQPGSWQLEQSVFLPEGWDLIIQAPFSLQMLSGSAIHCYGDANFLGNEESPITIFGPEKGTAFFTFNGGDVKIAFTHFENLKGEKENYRNQAALNMIKSKLELSSSNLIGNDEKGVGVYSYKGSVFFHNTHLKGWKKIGISEFSTVHFNQVYFGNAKKGWSLKGCQLDGKEVVFKKVKKPLSLFLSSEGKISGLEITDAETAIEVSSNAQLTVDNFIGKEIEQVFVATDHNPLKGKTFIHVNEQKCENCKVIKQQSDGTEIILGK